MVSNTLAEIKRGGLKVDRVHRGTFSVDPLAERQLFPHFRVLLLSKGGSLVTRPSANRYKIFHVKKKFEVPIEERKDTTLVLKDGRKLPAVIFVQGVRPSKESKNTSTKVPLSGLLVHVIVADPEAEHKDLGDLVTQAMKKACGVRSVSSGKKASAGLPEIPESVYAQLSAGVDVAAQLKREKANPVDDW